MSDLDLRPAPNTPPPSPIDALAASLGITLDPAWRPGVQANYDISLRLATLVAAFPLDDAAELAPVFRP